MTRFLSVCIVVWSCVQPARACDLCSVFAASEARGVSGSGFLAGAAEQFTHFGTLQEDGHQIQGVGQYIDSSVSQVFFGYNFNSRFGVQANLPVIYRSFGSDTQHGTVSGIGDLSVVGSLSAYRKLTEEYTVNWSLLGGVKFPTGNPSELGVPDSALPEGIGGHDLALGSGSYDGLVGSSVFVRRDKFFVQAELQYGIRTEGAFEHQYANDLTWAGGPGAYLLLSDQFTLALQAVVSGETKGQDTFSGVPDPDSAETLVYLGPLFTFTWGERWSALAGVDWAVSRDNSGTQVMPDYRVRVALTVRF